MHTTATTKGQISIPAAIRKKFGITKGTRVTVEVDERNGTIVLKPITAAHIARLRGSLQGTDVVGELERERALDREREDEKRAPGSFSIRGRF